MPIYTKFRCPKCPCFFFTPEDLKKHLDTFGDVDHAKKMYYENTLIERWELPFYKQLLVRVRADKRYQ